MGNLNRLEKDYMLDMDAPALIAGISRLQPVLLKENPVGFCRHCGGELSSTGYFQDEKRWLVASICGSCDSRTLLSYDLDWNWIEDLQLPIASDIGLPVSAIPEEQLSAVFTGAEIRDMRAMESGGPYIRQNIYRARSKLERFQRLFGTKIKL